MRVLLTVLAAALLAACNGNPSGASSSSPDLHAGVQGPRVATREAGAIAGHPDRGSLFAYAQGAVVQRGATTWQGVEISEAHALRAAVPGGQLVVRQPDGSSQRLQYVRMVEHEDGNWTWVGRPAGAGPGTEAIITFGDKAVFGSIPVPGRAPLQLTTFGGRTWLVEADEARLAQLAAAHPNAVGDDFVAAPVLPGVGPRLRSTGAAPPAALTATAAGTAQTAAASARTGTVDIVVGYTSGFATRLGGLSQAITRLRFLVDTTNQAYANSEVGGQLRMVQAIQVDYPDATSNRSALFELSGVSCTSSNSGTHRLPDGGVNCTEAARPAALQPLATAREQYGADLVALVRKYESPENGSCGIAWLLGGGQAAIDAASAAFGYSIVSDSSGTVFPDPDNGSSCRNDNLAHEVGHNLGLQHDVETAQGADDTNTDGNLLDPEEYGRFVDSFGYDAPADQGNFFDIMAIRRSGKTSFLVFSNPNLTSCGGFPCGVAGAADTARTLNLTIPVVAAFRNAIVPITATWYRGDFDGDGKSDLLWRNTITGANVIWKGARSNQLQAVRTVSNLSWYIVGAHDFDGDGKSDILWRNRSTGQNLVWKHADATASQALSSPPAPWDIAGAGDFDGDGHADLLWRNGGTGVNVIWKSAQSSTPRAVTALTDLAWMVAAVADFDGDHKADILWRNSSSGVNVIWKSGNSTTSQLINGVATTWNVVAAADFDGDGKADILWRNYRTGTNIIWKSANSATPQAVTAVVNVQFVPVAAGDFDNDGKDDLMWRNVANGYNVIWRSANSTTPQAVTALASPDWLAGG